MPMICCRTASCERCAGGSSSMGEEADVRGFLESPGGREPTGSGKRNVTMSRSAR